MFNHVPYIPPDKEKLRCMLREHGISPTRKRLNIAQILFAQPQHLSAEQVLILSIARDAQVSKATVYNNLGLFARKGLIREVIVDPAKIFYDPTTAPHHHFYNIDTGELTDIAAGKVKLGSLPAGPAGTMIEGVDVIIRVRNQS